MAGDDDMALPADKTCGDCGHMYRCGIFGFTPGKTETRCSFSPSRFRQAKPQLPAPDGDGNITIWPRTVTS